MDFDFSEEQTLLKDQLERLLADRYGFEERKRHMAAAEGYSRDMWEQYAEMGLLALPFAEDDGGIGGGPVETMIVMEAFGRVLALEPWMSTAVTGGGFLRLGGTDAQRAALVPDVASGAMKLAFAHTERHSRYDLNAVETRALRDGAGWRLTGHKSVVVDGDSADRVFVTARTAGGPRDDQGIGVFMIDPKASGVTRRGYPTQDGRRAAELTLENVTVGPEAVFGHHEDGLPLVNAVVDQSIAALCAEAVGVMSAMQALTVDYLKVRKQFGMPIGAFQALQHRAVDMFVAVEQSRSMSYLAAMMAGSDDAAERGRSMHAAKAEIGRNGRACGESAIQLHGGVGMTDEYAVGHYFKRMTMIDVAFGDMDHHIARLADSGSLFD
jgi:pimeloyl-CoA dehydrogenase small subunit